MKTPPSKLDEFISAIAYYLTTSLARKSMNLQAGDPDAQAWAKAYSAAGCTGYATPEEAEQAIRRTLNLAPGRDSK